MASARDPADQTVAAEALGRLGDNPFYVLGLRPGCGRGEIEREGQKLLAMLELGLAKAERYASPVGERTRTADKVRQALAELRDPERRIVHELWARLPPDPIPLEMTDGPRQPVGARAADASEHAGGGAKNETASVGGEREVTGRTAPWTEARRAAGWERRR